MSKAEVIKVPDVTGSALPVTNADVEVLHLQRQMLKDFVIKQLVKGVDYGVVPGTKKPSLFKPGAEKLSRLFGMGVRMTRTDRIVDREKNFALYEYRAEVYLLKNDSIIIAQCEGSCNSQEKKYKERTVYAQGQQPKKETTPIFDILNTLQKMAQKRAYVGGVILAVGASDFFTQDIDDPQDAQSLNAANTQERQTARATAPKVKSATAADQVDNICPQCEGRMMVSKYPNKETGNHDWYCSKCKLSKPRAG